jgi:predicted metalloprotease with PDZ domain
LYEGVTEWAAHTMQLRGGLITLDDYLTSLHEKVQYDRTRTDTTYSLSRLGLNSFSDEGQRQYGNIYQKGALTATLLDIRLLELSGGQRGLRDVVLELARQYGPDRPISEKTFFQDFARLTYPEIGDFFRRYIQGAEPLPLQEYMAKVGVRYDARLRTANKVGALGPVAFEVRDANVFFTKTNPTLQAAGIAAGDQLTAVAGTVVDRRNYTRVLDGLAARPPGAAVPFTVRRDGTAQTVTVKLAEAQETKRYHFAVDPAAAPAQLALRQAWMRNL